MASMSPALQFLRTGSYSEGRRKIVLSLPKTSSAHDHPLPEQLIEGTLKQRIKVS